MKTANRLGRLHRLALYLPLILLITVALSQRFFVRAHGLSTWKGGGFGMFSTPIGNRELTVSFYLNDGRNIRLRRRDVFRLPISNRVKQDMVSLGMMPSSENYRSVVAGFESYEWALLPPLDSKDEGSDDMTDDLADHWPVPRSRVADDRQADLIDVSTFEVEVWEYTFNDQRNRLALTQIALQQD